MQQQLAESGQTIDAGSTLDTSAVDSLPAPVAEAVRLGMADSMHTVFITAIPFVVLGLIFTIFIKNKPLRTTVGEPEPTKDSGETFADNENSASAGQRTHDADADIRGGDDELSREEYGAFQSTHI